MRILTILTILLFCQTIKAQDYFVKNYTINDGLPENMVTAVYQDKKGLIWLTTQSKLIRFDGNKFIEYPCGNEAISYPTYITELSNGTIIIVQENNIFCQVNGILQRVSFPKNIVPAEMFIGICDTKDRIWIGCMNGTLIRFTLNKDIAQHIKIFQFTKKPILSLYEDTLQDRIIIGSILNLFEIKNDKSVNIFTSEKGENGLYYFVTTNKNGNLCFVDNRFNELNSKNERISKNRIYNNIYTAIPYFQGNYEEVFSIQDSIFIKKGVISTYIGNYYSNANNISGVSAQGLADAYGNYWIGHSNGLLKISPIPITTNNFPKEKNIYGKIIYHKYYDSSTSYFLNEKLQLFKSKNGKISLEPFDSEMRKIKNKFGENYYAYLLKYYVASTHFEFLQNKKMIFFSSGHVIIFDLQSGKITYINNTSSTLANSQMCLDRDNNCFFVSEDKFFYTNGDSVIEYKRSSEISANIEYMEATSERIWFLMSNKIVFFDRASSKIGEVKIPSSLLVKPKIVKFLKLDEKTFLVVTALQGVLKMTIENYKERFTQLISSKNLIEKESLINAFIDNKGKLWLFGVSNVYIANIQAGNSIHFSSFNDFNSEHPFYFTSTTGEFYNLYYSRLENKIWNYTNPAKAFSINIQNAYQSIIDTPFKLYFSNILVDNFLYNDSISSELYHDRLKEIRLKNSQNNIEIKFGIMNYIGVKGLRIQYYLEGFDTSWIHETDNGEAKYTNLPQGKYRFHIRVSNEISGDKYFSFIVLPPWYRTWWAYVIFTLLSLGILWAFFYWRITVIKKRAAVEKLILDQKLKAIRALINPHFLQNVFNLMATHVRTAEQNKTISLIHKVSAYMRQVLYKAEKSIISLEDEIEYTDEYLKVQQVISQDLFSYTIRVDENVDTLGIEVPSMLLQPLVENCIKHGFSKIHNGGKIDIHITEVQNIVSISIMDNGKGLVNSDSISNSSRGVLLTKQRLNMLFDGRGKEVVFNIQNRHDGLPGAEVILKFPI